MSELEDRIREALHDPRRELPTWPDPMPRIRSAARRRRARLALGALLAAALAAAAIVAPVLLLFTAAPMRTAAPCQPGPRQKSIRCRACGPPPPARPGTGCAEQTIRVGELARELSVSKLTIREMSPPGCCQSLFLGTCLSRRDPHACISDHWAALPSAGA